MSKVIDVYIEKKEKNISRNEIIHAMESKIIELGPSNVSRYCADFKKMVVVDIAPSSIDFKNDFITVASQYEASDVLHRFVEPNIGDSAYHLEIPNPETSRV